MSEQQEIRFCRAIGEHGYLSNLYSCEVRIGGRTFTCAEKAYQFGKPRDAVVADWLMQAPSASLCAQAAHALFGWQIQPDWAHVKVPRMKAVLRAKFSQHPELREKLLATGNARLVEESPMDAFWGIGKSGKGKNMLGELLMEVREELRKEATE